MAASSSPLQGSQKSLGSQQFADKVATARLSPEVFQRISPVFQAIGQKGESPSFPPIGSGRVEILGEGEIPRTNSPVGKAEAPLQAALPKTAFGAEKWRRYFGEVGIEPPLPSEIHQILHSPCPFWPTKRVEETHLLTLIPASVNGRPFCLDLLRELIENPKTGYATTYASYGDSLKRALGQECVGQSYWALLTRDVLPDTHNIPLKYQSAVFTQRACSLPYKLPRVLEAATALLMEHVQSKNYLFEDNPALYMRCSEQINGFPADVGDFGPRGLKLTPYGGFYDAGLAAVRTF